MGMHGGRWVASRRLKLMRHGRGRRAKAALGGGRRPPQRARRGGERERADEKERVKSEEEVAAFCDQPFTAFDLAGSEAQ